MSTKSKQSAQIRQLRQSGLSLSRAQVYATGARKRPGGRMLGLGLALFGGLIAISYGVIAVTQAQTAGPVLQARILPTPETVEIAAVQGPQTDTPPQTTDLLAAVTRSNAIPALDPVIAPILMPVAAPILAPVPPPVMAEPDCVTPLAASAAALTISFGSGSADLAPDQLAGLTRLVSAITACPTARVMIAGHSDASGADYDNLLLSWQRAEAVAAAVAGLTPATDQYETIGYGSREPLLGADGSPLIEASRRVELRVLRAPDLNPDPTGE